jgi:hypothetical protein
MRLPRRLFLAAVAFVTVAALTPAREQPQSIRALFIGNSFTYVNDLPKMIADLARAGKQRPFEHDRETPGGTTLEQHWKNGKAVPKIAAGKWDYVVLQEQSQRPLVGRPLMFEYAGKLDAEIKKQSATTLLYQTWSRQDAPEKQADLSQAYLDLGKELKARVAPVGTAWGMALKENPTLVLHAPDKSHPAKAGTYLAACVFYGVIYGQNPEGLPGTVGGVSDDDAKRLQAVAWTTVQELDEKK